MSYLLDTNVVCETSKPAPDQKCIAWLLAHKGQCHLSAVTIAEIRYGIERLPAGKRKTAAEKQWAFLAADYSGRFFDFDGPAAVEWGRYVAELEVKFGSDWWKQFDLRDTQIAAIAREYGMTVATRNTKHFPLCPTEDPFA